MFCIKLGNYLHGWYGKKVELTVYTNDKKKYLKLIQNNSKFTDYKIVGYNSEKRIKNFVKTKHDGYICAPHVKDTLLSTVLIPFKHATVYNTLTLSEYNVGDPLVKRSIDFYTGVGENMLGLMFENYRNIKALPKKLKLSPNKFILMYLNKNDSDDKVQYCAKSFLFMVAEKYKNTPQLQVVLNDHLENDVKRSTSLLRTLEKNFSQIHIITKNDDSSKIQNINKLKGIIFRFDILPQPNAVFLSLIKHSARDICLTGDQSITDTLSCCSDKNIFYQIMPWKYHFAKALSIHLPNKYLKTVKTSCGALNAIFYKSNYKGVTRKWNFDTRAKPVFDRWLIYLDMIAPYQ